MDRTLDFFPFTVTLISTFFCIVICSFNMYLLAKHKRSMISIYIHVISIFAVLALISYLMSTVVFIISLSEKFQQLLYLFLFLFFFSLILGIPWFLITSHKKYSGNLSHNIAQALADIEDIVFITDTSKNIRQINHPQKFYSLFGVVDNINDLVLSDFDTPYLMRFSPIVHKDITVGYTVILEDMSAVRDSENALLQQNTLLQLANEKLSEYLKMTGALKLEEERLQILEHVQQTLIQDVKHALSYIQHIKEYSFKNATYQSDIKTLTIQLRAVYHKLRDTIGTLSGKEV